MSKVDTLIISPKYRPNNDGLSDYTYYFFNTLRKNTHDGKIFLLTTKSDSIVNFAKDDSNVFPILSDWDGVELLQLVQFVKEHNPKNILVQYVPTMYGRAGINLLFPFILLYLRFFQKRTIHLMAHELYFPFKFNIKSALTFAWHIWNLTWLSLSSKKIFTPTEHFVKLLKRFPFNEKKASRLPVGPNIARNYLGQNNISNSEKINIVFFGTLAEVREPQMVFKLFENYFNENPLSKISVSIIGDTEEKFKKIMGPNNDWSSNQLYKRIQFKGKLNEEQVAQFFNQCHFSINYFMDGISSRRGSAISALNSGVPILTNHNIYSDKVFLNQPAVMVVGENADDFKIKLNKVLSKIENNNVNDYQFLRQEAMNFIDQNFSWDKICKYYLQDRVPHE